MSDLSDVGLLLEAARSGDTAALPAAYGAMYHELRAIAHARLRGSADFTLLNTTALVHESYLRLLRCEGVSFADRGRLLAYAARIMRSVIVDFVRERQTARRGANFARVPLESEFAEVGPRPEAEVLAVHAALEELEKAEPRLAEVVEMRYFGGLTETEIAGSMGVTERTVRRDWEKARVLLRVALE